MHYPLSWLVPLALVGLYILWGLSYQARLPEDEASDSAAS